MNRALVYLWFTLLKRRAFCFCLGLRRPTTFIGFAAVAGLIGFLFYYRKHDIFGQLVRRETMMGCALLMLCGSLFKGFLQRGLVFEPPDLEFLFTSPFTRRQVVFYRLLPGYLFALVQGLVFLGLFAPHLKHPALTTLCFIFFQIACFHAVTASAIFAGTFSDTVHHRVRWIMLGAYFLLTAAYLRAAWDIKIIPVFATSPFAQLLFYPAVTLSDAGTTPSVGAWTVRLLGINSFSTHPHWQSAFYLTAFGAGAVASLWLLFKLKADIFETSLATTTRAAEKRLRLQQGRRVFVTAIRASSVRLPGPAFFRGVGAIVWKNLLVARRSRREVILAFVFTFVYTAFLTALLWRLHDYMSEAKEVWDVSGFHLGIASCLAFLAFLLQWMFPFDFRRDGHHIVGFRTLPVSPFALALAEIAVPTAFCLACQAPGVAVLLMYARFDWPTVLLLLLVYPAVALALNGVWNLHYLLSATRRAGGQAQTASAVGSLIVVALSFLIFYPAGWTAVRIGDHFAELGGKPNIALAGAGFLGVQYLMDFVLVLTLAKLFQRFEVSRDSQ
jgi:hypothetical protein